MRKLVLIGIGAGDPRQLTLEAVEALGKMDIAVFLDKRAETSELGNIREALLDRFGKPELCRVHLDDPPRAREGDYLQNVEAWHLARVELLERSLMSSLPDEGTAGLLVWGEPALYDSALRLAERIRNRGILDLDVKVIPGISSVQLLAAGHCIPLNQLNSPVHITTGRRLREEGFPDGVDEVIVMLDGECSFTAVAEEDMEICWGAYLGMADEILLRGRIREVSARIQQERQKARERKGWIMDTYLLRRVSALERP